MRVKRKINNTHSTFDTLHVSTFTKRVAVSSNHKAMGERVFRIRERAEISGKVAWNFKFNSREAAEHFFYGIREKIEKAWREIGWRLKRD